MSGHSKWANIKRRKGETDAKRGRIFTKIGRKIVQAVSEGGADPNTNAKLKYIIAEAKAANMPNDNIMRSIKKAAGDGVNVNYEDIIYEGYGPGGVAVIVEAMTDNRNRTAADVRHYFDKFGGNLGTTGCVAFMFDKMGMILVEKAESIDEDGLMMDALDAGAEDFNVQDQYYEISTTPDAFSGVRETLENKGYAFLSAEVEMVPQNTVALTDEKQLELMNKLVDNLEDLDDVQNVYHNWDQPDSE